MLVAGLFVLAAGLAASSPANAQNGLAARDSSTAESGGGAPHLLSGGRATLGLQLQATADVWGDPSAPGTGTNGFNVARARVKVRGDVGRGVSYTLQTELTSGVSVLDARIRYRAAPALFVDGGLYKAPFSAEFLRSSGALDYIERARVVNRLAPNRQIGAMVGGRAGDFSYRLGAFNGNGRTLTGNDDAAMLYVARAAYRPALGVETARIGANVAYSDRDTDGFTGRRLLVGVDARLKAGRWLVSTERIDGFFDPAAGAAFDRGGMHVTAGYDVVPDRHQVLLRWDTVTADFADDRTDWALGYTATVNEIVRLQATYRIPTVGPTTGWDGHNLSLLAQVDF
jgi:hypothetical protein